MAARQDKQVTHLSVQIVARVEVSVPVVPVVLVVAGHTPCGRESRVSEGKSELNRPKSIGQKISVSFVQCR